jgi:hypothetical protein
VHGKDSANSMPLFSDRRQLGRDTHLVLGKMAKLIGGIPLIKLDETPVVLMPAH